MRPSNQSSNQYQRLASQYSKATSVRANKSQRNLSESNELFGQKIDEKIICVQKSLISLEKKIDSKLQGFEQKFDKKIDKLDKKIDKQRISFDQKLQGLEYKLDQSIDKQTKFFETQLGCLEQRLVKKIDTQTANYELSLERVTQLFIKKNDQQYFQNDKKFQQIDRKFNDIHSNMQKLNTLFKQKFKQEQKNEIQEQNSHLSQKYLINTPKKPLSASRSLFVRQNIEKKHGQIKSPQPIMEKYRLADGSWAKNKREVQ